MPSSTSSHMNGITRQVSCVKRACNVGLARPYEAPLSRLVLVKPGWAALDINPQPPWRLRRSNSTANISCANLATPYECMGL